MLQHARLNKLMVPVFALTVVLTFACRTAHAQVKPFKVTGGGIVDFVPSTLDTPAFHFAVGTATELGDYYGDGKVQLDEFLSPTSAAFSSAVPFVFTAANGDKLAFHYGRTDFGAAGPGIVQLFPADDGKVVAVWVAEFNPVPDECTGRFQKVIGGSFIMTAVTEPFVFGSSDPVAYTWSGDGSIEYQKGN
jgi:hypothetical protein